MEDLLGLKIKRIRYNYNLSQERFGMKLGLSGKTISAYERGITHPSLRVLEKISRIYNSPLINEGISKRVEVVLKIQEMEDLLCMLKKSVDEMLPL